MFVLGVYSQEGCVDAVPTCSKLAELGYCEKNDLVRSRCVKSCNTGPCKEDKPTSPPDNNCPDTSPTCPRLSELGYCEKNALVRERCKKSCNTPCDDVPTVEPTDKPEPKVCHELERKQCAKASNCVVRYNKLCDDRENPWMPKKCSELDRYGTAKICKKVTAKEGPCRMEQGKCMARVFKNGDNCKKLKLSESACKIVRGCRWATNKKGKGKCKGKVRVKK